MTKSSKDDQLAKLKAENAKLKAENAKLKKATVRGGAKTGRKPWQTARSVTALILVTFAVALLVAGNLLFWFGNTVVKSDRWVAATSPIIKDPVVQDTLALYTTNKVFENVDVESYITQVLPPRADFLAPQLAGQIKGGAQKALDKALASPKFQDTWNQVQQRQHDRLISFASKYQGDADISVNEIVNQLTASLADTKLSFLAGKQLPSSVGDIKVISAPNLPKFHNVVVHIDAWRTTALLLMVACVAGAVWLSRNRRRMIYIFTVASVLTLLATMIAFRVARETIASKADPQYADGVRHIFTIFFHPLFIQTATIMAAALVVWFVAWISGPSRGALAVKRQVSLVFSGKLHQSVFANENRATIWFHNHKRLLQWLLVAAFGILLLIVRITITGLVVYGIILLVLILAIEVIAGQGNSRTKPA